MEKYIKMMALSAQIEVLQELPYKSVVDINSSLKDVRIKSAIMMDDLVDILNAKRAELSELDGTASIQRLKNIIKEQDREIEKFEKK